MNDGLTVVTVLLWAAFWISMPFSLSVFYAYAVAVFPSLAWLDAFRAWIGSDGEEFHSLIRSFGWSIANAILVGIYTHTS